MQNLMEISETNGREPASYKYKKSSHKEIFESLQSLRKSEAFCDIKLATDDGTVISAHKIVLTSASSYFHTMFTKFAETNKDLVIIRELHSTALQLIVDFIYTGEITLTENNVEILLPAANILQLEEIKDACCDFLVAQLHPTNCFSIQALADLHCCMKLFKSSEFFIHKHFSEIVEDYEFLSFSTEQVIKLISSDKLKVSSEEKVFECVIRWVKHDLDLRKYLLPLLMEHVRLPLTSKDFILNKVFKEPIVNDCLKCKDYITEALDFHLLSTDEIIAIPQYSRIKPRLGDQVIFVVDELNEFINTRWYDPVINQWNFGPQMITSRSNIGLAVLNNCVFAAGGYSNGYLRSVEVLDLYSESPRWKLHKSMIVERSDFGIGVINGSLYAVGGYAHRTNLKSAEVFDCSTQEWRMVSDMSIAKFGFGVGVLNDLLYVVGGYDKPNSSRRHNSTNSVECYNPSTDTWKPIADMCERRWSLGVGVLDGVLYAIGGHDGSTMLRSVETYRPSTGVWTKIADMHLPRLNAGVVVLDGLLYVIGGSITYSTFNTVEFYNPDTNTWTIDRASVSEAVRLSRSVAISRPAYF